MTTKTNSMDVRSARFEKATFAKVTWRIIPLLFIGYVAAFLDRINVSFAKLQMASDLQLSDAVYGAGAGIFFIGYFLFEVPANLVLKRVGARLWMARIMITWGLISVAFMFTGSFHWGPIASSLGYTDSEFTFYALRFLLGVAEAGYFPGVILYLTYWFPSARRAEAIALFAAGIAVASVVGAPLSGAILQYFSGAYGLPGWQWLFLLEGVPSVFIGVLLFVFLSDSPSSADWLNDEERALIHRRIDEDEHKKIQTGFSHGLFHAFTDLRFWMLTTTYFCGGICFYAIVFWMPTIIQEFGIAPDNYFEIGLLSMIPYGTALVTQIYWARRSDATGERRWHSAAGGILALIGMLLLAFFYQSPVLSLIAMTLIVAGLLSWLAVFWAMLTALLSGTAAAAGIALINSIGNLGGYVGPAIIGQVRDAAGGRLDVAFGAMAALALIAVLLILLVPEPGRRPLVLSKPATNLA